MPHKPALFVRPEVRTYGRGEADRMQVDLQAAAAATLVEEASSSSALKMTPEGVAGGGRRYTLVGLRQVCQVACPGLFQAIVDLAGAGRTTGDDPALPSLRDAVAIFNRVVELRFDARFASRQRLLVDSRAGTIDGLLGPGYTQIENAEVFERAAEAAMNAGDQELDRATIVGRMLQVRFAASARLFAIPGPDDVPDGFHAGTHLINSEVGGESTLRVATTLHRARDGTASLGRWLGGRRVHAGREFHKKAAAVFAAAASAAAQADGVASRAAMMDLRAASLGLRGGERDRTLRYNALVSRLRDHGLRPTVARSIVADATYRGGYGPTGYIPSGPAELTSAAAARSALDLYGALTAAGRDLYDRGQHEGPEQAADALLHRRLKLP